MQYKIKVETLRIPLPHHEDKNFIYTLESITAVTKLTKV